MPDAAEPHFPFRADHDPRAEQAALGPIDRRDAVVSAALLIGGGVIGGASAAVAILMLLIAADPGALLSLVAPGVIVLAGLVIVLLRLRLRQRAWPFAAAALGLALVLAVLGPIWWAADARLT